MHGASVAQPLICHCCDELPSIRDPSRNSSSVTLFVRQRLSAISLAPECLHRFLCGQNLTPEPLSESDWSAEQAFMKKSIDMTRGIRGIRRCRSHLCEISFIVISNSTHVCSTGRVPSSSMTVNMFTSKITRFNSSLAFS